MVLTNKHQITMAIELLVRLLKQTRLAEEMKTWKMMKKQTLKTKWKWKMKFSLFYWTKFELIWTILSLSFFTGSWKYIFLILLFFLSLIYNCHIYFFHPQLNLDKFQLNFDGEQKRIKDENCSAVVLIIEKRKNFEKDSVKICSSISNLAVLRLKFNWKLVIRRNLLLILGLFTMFTWLFNHGHVVIWCFMLLQRHFFCS